jgi:16S rRNA processing protein RimM
MSTARATDPSRQPPQYLLVGEIVAPFGTRGELKVLLDTDFPELVLEATHLYLGEPPTRWAVEWARPHQALVRLKLAGCDSRDAAESLRGQSLQVPAAAAPAPAEGEYYYYQLIGLQAWTVEGELLGQVVDVFPTGSNAVLVVRSGSTELLLPAIESVVQEVDLAAGRLCVHLLEGLR